MIKSDSDCRVFVVQKCRLQSFRMLARRIADALATRGWVTIEFVNDCIEGETRLEAAINISDLGGEKIQILARDEPTRHDTQVVLSLFPAGNDAFPEDSVELRIEALIMAVRKIKFSDFDNWVARYILVDE